MITFKKGDAVKYIDPESKLIPILEADGWEAEKKAVRHKKEEKEVKEEE